MQDVDQPRGIAAVQPNRRLVQHVERAHQPRAQRRCQLNPLRFAAAQRCRQAVKREVFQANVVQKLQPLLNLLQDFSRDLRLLRRKLQVLEKLRCRFHRKLRQLAYIFAVDLYLQRVRPQPPPAALRTLRVPAIPAQKHPHMQLVFLALQHGKETLYAGKLAFAFNHQRLLIFSQIDPRDIERHVTLPRKLPQLGLKRAILRFGPRLNRAFAQRFGHVRDNQIQIEINGVAKALASRARAKRIVKREQRRFRLFIPDVAVLALEPLREAPLLDLLAFARCGFEHSLSRLAISHLQRVHNARPLVRRHHNAVHQHVQRLVEVDIQQRLRRGELKHLAVLEEPAKAFLAQIEQALAQRRRSGLSQGRGLGRFSAARLLFRRRRRRRRLHREKHIQPRAFAQRQNRSRHLVHRVFLYLIAAVPTKRAAHASVEQAQVVVNFGGRGHGGTGIARGILLPDGNSRRDAVNQVHVRLLNALQELPRVGREGLHVAPLAFGVDGVKGKGRLA